jgi:CubicO group peptidase (beta-lactamase class C family)
MVMRCRSLLLNVALSLVFAPSIAKSDQPKHAARAELTDFPRAEPADLGIDNVSLERLHERAKETDSDAVVIVKDGRLVADWDFGQQRRPIEARSVTKSIVNLAIGRLIDQGKIKSLEQPVSEFYPEWNQGRKKLITIRHLLNHTSGLESPRVALEIDRAPDCIQYALAAELTDDPGSKFYYNNKATNLLAGIVQRASGKRMDVFIREEIFEPLGIKDFGWSLDKAGNPYAMAGLQIRAIDLAKIGQLMLDEGAWKGRQIVSKEWVRKSVAPGQSLDTSCGLLWWIVKPVPGPQAVDEGLVKFFKDHGMTAQSVKKLEPLMGKPLDTEAAWEAVRMILRSDEVLNKKLMELNKDFAHVWMPERPVLGFAAEGSFGQYLFVSLRHRLIGVRQRQPPPPADREDPIRDFGKFMEMVAKLVPDKPK